MCATQNLPLIFSICMSSFYYFYLIYLVTCVIFILTVGVKKVKYTSAAKPHSKWQWKDTNKEKVAQIK